jgi:nitrogen regulatory protein PII 1
MAEKGIEYEFKLTIVSMRSMELNVKITQGAVFGGRLIEKPGTIRLRRRCPCMSSANKQEEQNMKMIRAFIRPEKEQEVVLALEGAGFPSLTKMPVFGRGKQKGLQVGPVHYDELPKTLIMTVIDDADVDRVIQVIQDKARSGFIGDGKIFVSPVDNAYTIRTGEAGL